jgi:hypothetical protein
MGLKEGGARGSLRNVSVGASVIPYSAIHQWKLDDVETGTATDSVGSADGSVTGVSSVSGDYVGGSAGSGDGSDDYIDVGNLGSFGGNMDTDFAVLFTYETTDQNSIFTAVDNVNDSTRLQVNSGRGIADGAIGFRLQDSTGDAISIATDSTSLADGTRRRIGFNKTGNSASDLEIYINGSSVNVSVREDQAFSNPTDFDTGLALFARNLDGTIRDYIDAVMDNVIITDDSLSSQEFTDDYNRQPWS